jgi:hypothetical protein
VRQPDWNATFYLNTDASAQAISAVLLQKFGEDFHPVSYFSKTLNKAESKYAAIKLELMAIVKAVEAFKSYLYNRHFFILSDSKPLKHYHRTESPVNIITRWLLTLGEYSFTFQHVPGKTNLLPDYFSRDPIVVADTLENDPNLVHSDEILPVMDLNENVNTINCNEDNFDCVNCTGNLLGHKSATDIHDTFTHIGLPPFKCNLLKCNNSVFENVQFEKILSLTSNTSQVPLNEITSNELLCAQLRDNVLGSVYNQANNFPAKLKPQFFIDDCSMVLMTTKGSHNGKDSHSKNYRICLPDSLVSKAIGIAHTTHLGIAKTYELVSARYYSKGLFQKVTDFVKRCDICNTTKNLSIPKAPLQSKEIPTRPLDIVTMDILGPFQNNIYVLNMVDIFTRHLQLYVLNRVKANDVVEALFNYITLFGRPRLIHSDNGSQFIATVFKLFLEKFNIKLSHSSVSHPEANAVSERVNTSTKNTVYCLQKQNVSLKHALALHCAVYNSTIHPSSKSSPNLVHFGRALPLITDTFDPSELIILDSTSYVERICKATNKIREITYKNLKLAQFKQNSKVNNKRSLRPFKVGDIAYLKHPNKFKKGYSGPYFVKKMISPVVAVIQEYENLHAPCLKRHINLLHWAPPRKSNFEHTNESIPNSAPCDLSIDQVDPSPMMEVDVQSSESMSSDVPQQSCPDALQPDECPVDVASADITTDAQDAVRDVTNEDPDTTVLNDDDARETATIIGGHALRLRQPRNYTY